MKIIQRDRQYFYLFNNDGIKCLKKLNYEIKFYDTKHLRKEKKGEIVYINDNYNFVGKLIFQDYAYLKILNRLTKIRIHKEKYCKLTIEGFEFITNHYPNITLLTNKEIEKESKLKSFQYDIIKKK